MTDTPADLPERARPPYDDPIWDKAAKIYGFVCMPDPVTLGEQQMEIIERGVDALQSERAERARDLVRAIEFHLMRTDGDGDYPESIKAALAFAKSGREAAIKEMIAECDRIRASYPTELNGAYRPLDAQGGWDEACLRLRATCIALALPKEETRR